MVIEPVAIISDKVEYQCNEVQQKRHPVPHKFIESFGDDGGGREREETGEEQASASDQAGEDNQEQIEVAGDAAARVVAEVVVIHDHQDEQCQAHQHLADLEEAGDRLAVTCVQDDGRGGGGGGGASHRHGVRHLGSRG